MYGSLGSECTALHQCVNKFTHAKFFLLCFRDNFVGEFFIRESEGTAQSVFDQVFGESVGEVFFSGGDEVAEFVVVSECRAFVEGSRSVNRPGFSVSPFASGMVCGAPLTGGVEVLQSETDRVNLAVAACALGFFLVGQQALASGQDLIL